MFFPERLKSINKFDKVLEVGPGGAPFPRSNILLDKQFATEKESFAQRGFTTKIDYKQKILFYDGGSFPFKDNEFDYVICSHVLEHVSESELPNFIFELQRVAKKGYIEFPTAYYEIINFQPVHLWFMNYRDNEILFFSKFKFQSNYLHKSFRELVYDTDGYLADIFSRYKDFFFIGFEWDRTIKFSIIDKFDDLICEQDYLKNQELFEYFKNNKPNNYLQKFINIKNIVKSRLG